LNETQPGALTRVWGKRCATARLRLVVVVVHERPGLVGVSRKHSRWYNTTDVMRSELAFLHAGVLGFGHAAGWADYADSDRQCNSTKWAKTQHTESGTAAAVTMLLYALMSTALYVCLVCAAPVLGARYQRREAHEIVRTTAWHPLMPTQMQHCQ